MQAWTSVQACNEMLLSPLLFIYLEPYKPSSCSVYHCLSPPLPAISDSRPAVLVQSATDIQPTLSTPISQTDSL